jgi:hypothetical protein
MENHTIENGTTLTNGQFRVRFTLQQDTYAESPLKDDCAYQDTIILYYGNGYIDGATDVSSEENILPAMFDELPEEHRKVARPETLKYADVEIFDEDGDGTTLEQYLYDVNLFDYSWTAEEIEMFFDELKSDFFDELHPKVRATFASFYDFAKTVFGQPNYRDFLDCRIVDCFNAGIIDYEYFSTENINGVLVDLSHTRPTAKELAKTLTQYLNGEVYVAGATVEKLCDCCNTWSEIHQDVIGGIYEPADELISFPWADYIVPEILSVLPAGFFDDAES